jgi:catechol-2,3-dioxygenase
MERPFTALELDHVVLRCHDQERMLRFYTEVVGLPEERRLEAIGLVQLRAGRSLVDLIPDADPSTRVPNVDHVCLAIAARDMDSVLAWLAAHEVETIGEPMTRYVAHGYAASIYLRDPEGNVVELALVDAGGA